MQLKSPGTQAHLRPLPKLFAQASRPVARQNLGEWMQEKHRNHPVSLVDEKSKLSDFYLQLISQIVYLRSVAGPRLSSPLTCFLVSFS
jgi:hypothetical protein